MWLEMTRLRLPQIKEKNYDAIIISPGPGTPEDKKYFRSMLRGYQRHGAKHSQF